MLIHCLWHSQDQKFFDLFKPLHLRLLILVYLLISSQVFLSVMTSVHLLQALVKEFVLFLLLVLRTNLICYLELFSVHKLSFLWSHLLPLPFLGDQIVHLTFLNQILLKATLNLGVFVLLILVFGGNLLMFLLANPNVNGILNFNLVFPFLKQYLLALLHYVVHPFDFLNHSILFFCKKINTIPHFYDILIDCLKVVSCRDHFCCDSWTQTDVGPWLRFWGNCWFLENALT